jgi:hypothetical protein
MEEDDILRVWGIGYFGFGNADRKNERMGEINRKELRT